MNAEFGYIFNNKTQRNQLKCAWWVAYILAHSQKIVCTLLLRIWDAETLRGPEWYVILFVFIFLFPVLSFLIIFSIKANLDID